MRWMKCALIVVLCSACGSTPGGDAGTDTGTTTDGSALSDSGEDAAIADSAMEDSAVGDAMACTMAATGSVVTSMLVAMESPMPTGGTIVDGAYRLTSITGYTGPGGMTGTGTRALRGAMRFQGMNYELYLEERGVGDGSSGTFTASGTMFTVRRSCPATAGARGFPYNASATRFELYLPPNLVLTFERQ